MHHYSGGMATDLDVDVVAKEPVAVEKDEDDQYTESFKKIKRILPNIVFVDLKLPVDERSDSVVDRIPKA